MGYGSGNGSALSYVLARFVAGKSCERNGWSVNTDGANLFSYRLAIARKARNGAVWVLSPEDVRAWSRTTRGHCKQVCAFFGLYPVPEQPRKAPTRQKRRSTARQIAPMFPGGR